MYRCQVTKYLLFSPGADYSVLSFGADDGIYWLHNCHVPICRGGLDS